MIRFIQITLIACWFSGSVNAQQTPLANYPHPAEKRDDAVAVALGDYLYTGTGLAEGFYLTNDWWRFSNTSKTWERLENLPFPPRQYLNGFAHGTCVYLFGGYSSNTVFHNDLWQYNTETEKWKQLDSLPGPKRWASFAFTLGDYAYIGGGQDTGQIFADFYRFNFKTETWEQLNDLPFGGRVHVASADDEINAYVGLGRSNTSAAHNDLYQFNPLSLQFNLFHTLPKRLERCKATVVQINGEPILHLFAGRNENVVYNDYLYQLNLNTKKLDSILLDKIPARRSANVAHFNGKIAVLFGVNAQEQRLNDCVLLDVQQTNHSIQHPNLEVFPNPVNGKQLAVQSSVRVTKMEILSLGGTVVYEESWPLAANRMLVDAPKVDEGIYIARFTHVNGEVLHKKVLFK